MMLEQATISQVIVVEEPKTNGTEPEYPADLHLSMIVDEMWECRKCTPDQYWCRFDLRMKAGLGKPCKEHEAKLRFYGI